MATHCHSCFRRRSEFSCGSHRSDQESSVSQLLSTYLRTELGNYDRCSGHICRIQPLNVFSYQPENK